MVDWDLRLQAVEEAVAAALQLEQHCLADLVLRRGNEQRVSSGSASVFETRDAAGRAV